MLVAASARTDASVSGIAVAGRPRRKAAGEAGLCGSLSLLCARDYVCRNAMVHLTAAELRQWPVRAVALAAWRRQAPDLAPAVDHVPSVQEPPQPDAAL